MQRRNQLGSVLLAAAATLAIGALAPAAQALTGPQEIAFLNQQRAANGIPGDLTEVPEWSQGCAMHMAYLRATGKFQHPEDKTDLEYTDQGNAAGTTAVLTSGGAAFSPSGVNAFENAPIHLMQMLNPFLLRSGAADGCLATQRDTSRAFTTPTTFSYPGDGGSVPASQTSYEGPFVPAAFVGLAKGADNTHSVLTGPSLYFYNAGTGSAWFSRGAITAASVTGPRGPVEVRTVDNTTSTALGNLGLYLSPGGIVMPTSPLLRDTRYTASVQFQPTKGGPPVQRTWSFTTTASAGALDPSPPPAPAPGPAPAATVTATATVAASPPVLKSLRVKRSSLQITLTKAQQVTVRLSQRVSKKGHTPVRYKLRKTLKVKFRHAGTKMVTYATLAKGDYRAVVSSAGAELSAKTLTLR